MLMSVVYRSVLPEQIVIYAKSCDLPAGLIKKISKDTKDTREYLVSLELLIDSGNLYWTCNPQVIDYISRFAFRQKWFPVISDLVFKKPRFTIYDYPETRLYETLAHVRNAVYSNNVAYFEKEFSVLTSLNTDSVSDKLTDFVFADVDEPCFAGLHPEIKFALLEWINIQKADDFSVFEKNHELLEQFYASLQEKTDFTDKLLFILNTQRLLRGDFSDRKKSIPEYSEASGLSLVALRDFLQGRYDSALENYVNAFDSLKKEKKSLKFISDFCRIFFPAVFAARKYATKYLDVKHSDQIKMN